MVTVFPLLTSTSRVSAPRRAGTKNVGGGWDNELPVAIYTRPGNLRSRCLSSPKVTSIYKVDCAYSS